ncbi:MAG TPA: TorF family putative porin [Pseudolabrys sp.]
MVERHLRALTVLTIAAVGAFLVDKSALGQTASSNYGTAISLGGHGWSSFEGAPAITGREANQLEFSFRGGVATDYIYRGTTLSDHKPAAGGAIEATFGALYAGVAIASVKLPTQPIAEITFIAGTRQTIADVDLDFGVSYFAYPGEIPGSDTDYWQAAIRADKRINDVFRVAGGFAYSPNVSNTGAWSWYAAGGAGFDVPNRFLPTDIGVSFTGGAGYSWFGNQSLELGGFPLPAYWNWQAGVTFSYKVFNLDLRYYDTNLSKEDCFVLTGDPNARPGGAVNLITNPEGLTSRWCSATFVAKVSFALN